MNTESESGKVAAAARIQHKIFHWNSSSIYHNLKRISIKQNEKKSFKLFTQIHIPDCAHFSHSEDDDIIGGLANRDWAVCWSRMKWNNWVDTEKMKTREDKKGLEVESIWFPFHSTKKRIEGHFIAQFIAKQIEIKIGGAGKFSFLNSSDCNQTTNVDKKRALQPCRRVAATTTRKWKWV